MYVCGIRSSFIPSDAPLPGLTLELLEPLGNATARCPAYAWILRPEPWAVPHLPRTIARQLARSPHRGRLHVPQDLSVRVFSARLPIAGNGTVTPLLFRAGLLVDLPFALHLTPPPPPPYPLPLQLGLQQTRVLRNGHVLSHYPANSWLTIPAERIIVCTVRHAPRQVTLQGYIVREPGTVQHDCPQENAPVHDRPSWVRSIHSAAMVNLPPEPPSFCSEVQ